MASKTTFINEAPGGGQFAPESGGQFAPDLGGQVRPESGGQIERIFHPRKIDISLLLMISKNRAPSLGDLNLIDSKSRLLKYMESLKGGIDNAGEIIEGTKTKSELDEGNKTTEDMYEGPPQSGTVSNPNSKPIETNLSPKYDNGKANVKGKFKPGDRFYMMSVGEYRIKLTDSTASLAPRGVVSKDTLYLGEKY